MKKLFLAITLPMLMITSANAQCPYDLNCINNPYGPNSRYGAHSINNPYSPEGSPYSNYSANNPYAINAPKIYDSNGNYHGRLSSNPYDPDSTSNPYGRYGNKYSSESINNPYTNRHLFIVPQSR